MYYLKLRGRGSCFEQIYKTRAVFGYVCASFEGAPFILEAF